MPRPDHRTPASWSAAALVQSLRLPVVAAPMFLVSGPDLVVAASTSGILGSFPTQNCRTPADLEAWLTAIVEGVGSRPWAVNLVTHRSNSRLADDLRLVAEFRPPVVITALGSPAPVMEVVKGYGGLVVADVVSLPLVRKAVAVGVDGLACIAAGAGGHTGQLSPFAFVSGVRDVFDGLVAVGGGITDGQGVAGAVAAGADLVYMGTRFIPTTESLAPQAYRQMVVDHASEDLVVSAGVTGSPASWLRPSLTAHGLDPDHLVVESGALDYDAGADPARRWRDLWAAGQGLQTIREISPVADVVDRLVDEFDSATARLADRSAARMPWPTPPVAAPPVPR